MHVIPTFAALVFASVSCAQNGLWAQLTFPSQPTPRWGASMAYDAARDRLVLISGMPSIFGGMQETWENDGSQWIFRGAIGPSGSIGEVAIVYDSVRQVCVAVRSPTGGGTFETWEWAGASWVLRAPATSPTGRRGFVMAFDTTRQRTVLYGGYVGTAHLADTWEYDGATWVLRTTGGPPGRAYAAMAFDAARGVCVVHGGRDDALSINFADTWEWNGTYWLQAAIVGAAGVRYEHSMVYDAWRQRCVVSGGRTQSGGNVTSTWEWDGTTWTNLQAPIPLPGGPAMAFDSNRQRTVSFGGRFFSSNIQNGTFAFTATTQVAAVTPYGAGCAGPAGVPTLTALPGSVPRLGATLQVRLGNLPNGGLNVPIGWVGFDRTQWNGVPLPLALDPLGFPGCMALLAPVSAYTLANNAGSADWSLAIPFLPAFAGFEFFVQGSVFVPGYNPGGLVFTRALACTVGR